MLHDILKNKLYHMIFKNKKNWLLFYLVIKIKQENWPLTLSKWTLLHASFV